MDSSTISSLDKDYDDGVYDKANPPAKHAPKSQAPAAKDKASKLPALMLACLVLLLVFCFVGTLVSGLYFNTRRVSTPITSSDCLGQSWIMFSSILGFLYLVLHLQAARKGEPINRAQPPSQHPLHSATVVVARLDAIAWVVSLIIASVVVARAPTPVAYVDLVACSAVTPTIAIILCVAEKAVRPFDLPYVTSKSSASSLLTVRVSALVDTMPEVTTEDSISQRGSYSSPQVIHNNHNTNHFRPTSHTQHAAAVAAAHPGNAASLSGPRPPPRTVKEARPWAFTNFDNRTKTELAASVNDASYTSDMRTRVGGPRPLADSEIAYRRGVLAPPVCSDPKVQRVPDRRLQKRTAAGTGTASQEGSRDGSSGAWGKDWSALKAETGYVTPASSADVTPMSTPRVPLGVPLFSSRIASRALSPVVEVDDKRSSGGSAGNTTAARPAPVPVPAPPRQVRTTSQYSAPASTTTTAPATRAYAAPPPAAGPRSHSYSQPPVTTTTRTTSTARYGSTLRYDNTGTLRPPPPPPPSSTTTTTTTTTKTIPATRVRLVRAQDSSSARATQQQQHQDRPRYETASLRRAPRLATSELRTPEDDRLFFVNPPPPSPSRPARPASGSYGMGSGSSSSSNNQGRRADVVRMPGSWE